MLKIQRASAGSGKTYTLAKTYLRLLLSVKTPGGKPRLRTPEETADSVQHILAVTFTNKATEEMKTRIVDKLSAIAVYGTDYGEPLEKTDYLRDFAREFDVTPEAVATTARAALRRLLFAYSDFNVSTIDSFFQTILRTFAYETDLNDSYQLELDSKLTAGAGVDATLDAQISRHPDPKIRFWLNLLMETGANYAGWNIFQRGSSRLYTTLVKNAERMEKEQFKTIKADLDAYFKESPDLIQAYRLTESAYEDQVKDAYHAMSVSAGFLADAFRDAALSLKEHGCRNLESRIGKSLNGDYNESNLFNMDTENPGSVFKAAYKKNPYKLTEDADRIQDLYEQWVTDYGLWRDALQSKERHLWGVYRELLPYVPLLHEVANNIAEWLGNTNTLQISDTNTLLKRIIGDDEVPFIYERLGTRIAHFLIDEFQDTSRMQWENFHPLLSESESNGYENLIIGDAKQSIYRFRNADPSLITRRVPEAFPECTMAGDSKEENTNWRSLRNIVEFNNSLFSYLAVEISPEMEQLYSNVEQYPHHQEDSGYVEVNFYYGNSDATEEELAAEGGDKPVAIRKAGQIVSSLLDRGYRQQEIAFLVTSNQEGQDIVASLMRYNASLPDGEEKIKFISDQSLIVANARSVQTVVAAMRTIASGIKGTRDEGQGTKNQGQGTRDKGQDANGNRKMEWRDISTQYDFVAASHPEMPPMEIVRKLMEEGSSAVQISEMLGEMQTVSLPSMSEAIIDRFVSPELRAEEAPFIAAFQDAVLQYCDSNPADVGSFLEWWDRKAPSYSIPSPEKSDAVSIMTIHKSKGLEFDVVIVPCATFKFTPNRNKEEWAWVKPSDTLPEAGQLPPWLPVVINKNLEDTPHEEIWKEHQHLVAMDSLNLGYVAFTRAVKELYVYAQIPKKDPQDSIGKRMLDYLSSNEEFEIKNEESEDEDNEDMDIDVDIDIDDEAAAGGGEEGFPTFCLGRQLTPEEIASSRKKEPESRTLQLDGYDICANRGMLEYKIDEEPAPTDEDPDPRSIGNLMHDIMSRVSTADRIPQSVRRMHVRGIIGAAEAEEITRRLTEAVASVKDRGWFDPGLRVVNERSLLQRGVTRERPDRVVVTPDGHATVIDFKFGQHENPSRYRKQVRGYMRRILESGICSSVSGAIWYVQMDKIDDVSLQESEK